jgi:hypothetical protein
MAMKTVGKYTWGRTERGYGWVPWQGCGLVIKQEGKIGHYGVYEADGTLVCRCVTYQDAQKVVARFRRAERSRFNPHGPAYAAFAWLTETATGVTLHAFAPSPGLHQNHGAHFATRDEAEAFVQAMEHIFEDGTFMRYGHD